MEVTSVALGAVLAGVAVLACALVHRAGKRRLLATRREVEQLKQHLRLLAEGNLRTVHATPNANASGLAWVPLVNALVESMRERERNAAAWSERLYERLRGHDEDLRRAEGLALHSRNLTALGCMAAELPRTLNAARTMLLDGSKTLQELCAAQPELLKHVNLVWGAAAEIDDTLEKVRNFADAQVQDTAYPIALIEPLKEALAQQAPALRRRKIAVSLQVGPQLPPVFAHSLELVSALAQVLEASARPLAEGGMLSLSLGSADSAVLRLTVQGTGDLEIHNGVDSSGESLALSSSSRSKTPSEQQADFGLLVAQHIVAAHRGTLDTDTGTGTGTGTGTDASASARGSVGTRYVMTLPAAAAELA